VPPVPDETAPRDRPSVTPTEVALLVNPAAGKGRAGRAVEPVTARLRDAGCAVRVLTGTDAADARRLADEAVAGGAGALVTLGGDGLVNLAVQAVAETATPLGVVPAGSGNDIARGLGLPLRDPLAAADVVAAGHVRAVDAVRYVAGTPGDGVGTPGDGAGPAGDVEGPAGAGGADGPPRWFAGVLGAGFDSVVNERANRMRWPSGRQRYNLAILAELRVFRPLPFVLTVDGVRVETEAMLVAVGNAASYGGGMRVCPTAHMDDGRLEVTVVGPVSTPEFVRVFPRVYRGTHVRHRAVTAVRACQVSLSAPGVVAYADGERFGPLPATCTARPGALRVLLPPGT
jgi:diacylglycerol kinase (ATP)